MLKPRRQRRDLYQVWPEANRRTRARLSWTTGVLIALGTFIGGMGATVWTAAPDSDQGGTRIALLSKAKAKWQGGAASAASPSRTFRLCHTGGGQNCVVDGDTFWMDGIKVRVADIDAPETHPPRCPYEADLGKRATARLRELLNAGEFQLEPIPGRDEDRYHRKLRVVARGGRSLGDQLVSEGLARTWTGQRKSWC